MKHVLDIMASNGVPFRAVVDANMVEFFDRRYIEGFTPDGQFVSRYYVDTLIGDRIMPGFERGHRGLDLHGGIPDWTIDANTMDIVLSWLQNVR